VSATSRRQHPNAPWTPEGRRRMVACVLEDGWSVAATAERFQVDPKTVRKWRDRSLADGDAGLVDRSSRAASVPEQDAAAAATTGVSPAQGTTLGCRPAPPPAPGCPRPARIGPRPTAKSNGSTSSKNGPTCGPGDQKPNAPTPTPASSTSTITTEPTAHSNGQPPSASSRTTSPKSTPRAQRAGHNQGDPPRSGSSSMWLIRSARVSERSARPNHPRSTLRRSAGHSSSLDMRCRVWSSSRTGIR